MTTEPIPNPPAFPRPSGQGASAYSSHQVGMTLRDHFAGQALPAVMAATSAGQHHPGPVGSTLPLVRRISDDAYKMADAMLAERIKPIAAPAPAAVPTYTEEQRQRAMGHLVGAYPTDGLGDAVDAVAEALGMRKAGA